ncbi:hypothetical protein BD311DRAFT_669834 [Dichomitus squalens]|uniref:Uncharacterized protein n=1 Tax=Dichomitus squalens TaxID=114155 RepID=A0A4Q9MHG0_9APHY|nr:hypothetical protein BD311DRAFT_669834 [Dichomitus squalens]
MDAIRRMRGLVAGGPPYADDIPRPVLEFLTAMGGDDDCSDDSPEDSRYVDYSARYFLEAFEAYRSTPPPSDAPARRHLSYSLLRLALFSAREAYVLDRQDCPHTHALDDAAAGQLFLDLDAKFGDVFERLLDASNLGDILEDICPSSDDSPPSPACASREDRPPIHSPVRNNSVKPPSFHLPLVPPRRPSGPLQAFRSSGWGQIPSHSSPPSTPSTHPKLPPVHKAQSLWHDYSTSSSGFSTKRA